MKKLLNKIIYWIANNQPQDNLDEYTEADARADDDRTRNSAFVTGSD